MGITKKDKKTEEDASLKQRHKQAREFTRELVEELISSTGKSVSGK